MSGAITDKSDPIFKINFSSLFLSFVNLTNSLHIKAVPSKVSPTDELKFFKSKSSKFELPTIPSEDKDGFFAAAFNKVVTLIF